MRRTTMAKAFSLGLLALLAVPATVFAQEGTDEVPTVIGGHLDGLLILVGFILVFFMQAGFALLEIGFSRGKNVGMGIAKILVNVSIAGLVWWAVGSAVAGPGGWFAGNQGFFLNYGDVVDGSSTDGLAAINHIFGFSFAAVSLAIVWGTTLERMKFAAYIPFAVVFAGFIYPLIAHWSWGGGFFEEIGSGVQDFAGSSVVHLTGATAGLAALLLLGPRKGKFGPDGKPRAIPGHSMPLFGLGVLILWLGWFGFNGVSTLGVADNQFGEVVVVTNLGAAAGVIGAMLTIWLTNRTLDVGMIGNGAIAGLVAITAPSGYVEFWSAPIIGLIGGIIVVLGVLAIEKKLDDPVGALSAHGLAGIWGTLACGLFTSERLAEYNGSGTAGLFQGGGFEQLGTQAAVVALTFTTVFVLSLITFALIKATIGLRVDEADEDAGLDISEHGMYGYPEQFIPAAELVGYAPPDRMPVPSIAKTKEEVPT